MKTKQIFNKLALLIIASGMMFSTAWADTINLTLATLKDGGHMYYHELLEQYRLYTPGPKPPLGSRTWS